MGFRKINVEEEINRCIENNPEVEKSLKEADTEYEFIKLLVKKKAWIISKRSIRKIWADTTNDFKN
jgi:hypothetical protein